MKITLFFILFYNSLFASYATCKFKGQLGNQLFEIAATISIALDNNLEPNFYNVINAKGGKENLQNIFPSLNVQKINVDWHQIRADSKNIKKYTPIKIPKKKNIWLNGYFQSEKFFKKHSDVIRNLFKPSPEIKNTIYNQWNELLNQNCVALHFRTFHTDAPNTYASNRFGLDRLVNYFSKAIDFFPKDYIFLVFSDDLEYCKKVLPISDENRFYCIHSNRSHIDFYLMSFCKHQIVSPASTFSWWAAWLNDNPEKIVISSKIDTDNDQNDYIPDEWLKI